MRSSAANPPSWVRVETDDPMPRPGKTSGREYPSSDQLPFAIRESSVVHGPDSWRDSTERRGIPDRHDAMYSAVMSPTQQLYAVCSLDGGGSSATTSWRQAGMTVGRL